MFIKVGRRNYCPAMPGLGELGGLARWRVETSRRIFIKWRLRGRFLKFPTPPTVDRRGVPVGLSILLLILFLCVSVLERKNKVSTISYVEKRITKY